MRKRFRSTLATSSGATAQAVRPLVVPLGVPPGAQAAGPAQPRRGASGRAGRHCAWAGAPSNRSLNRCDTGSSRSSDSGHRDRVIPITLGVFISATTNLVLSKVLFTPGTV